MSDATSDIKELAHAELTEKIIGVFYEVYNELGTDSWNQSTRRQW